ISPDPIMGVSPTTVASVASFSIALTNRSGGGSVGPVDFFTFFSSVFVPNDFGLGGGQVLYDDQAGRFYVAAEEIDSSSTVAMDFAVSKTSSPATLGSGDWNFFHITEANEGDNLEAFTYLMGWNSDAVFLSMGMFHGEVTFDHNLILAISKASILAGGPLSTQATDVFTGADDQTLVPARMHSEAGGNLEYFVQSQGSSTSTTVNVVQDTGYLAGSGTFLTTPLTVNSYDNSPGVAGLTGKADNRILSVDWVNNGSTQHMVACGNIGAGGVNLARWYEFNAPTTGTPTLLQQGDINVGSAIATSFPSIAINPADSIAMTFLEDGYGQATSMYVTGRQATDPPNTMQDPILVQSGVLPVPDAVYGYGNYSGTEYDPANSANFWSINQFHSGATGQSFFGGIEIAEFTLLPASAPSPPTLMSPANQMVNEGTLIGLSPGFTDTSYGSWKVTIAWGDGSPNTTLNPTAPGLLGNQTHTYAEEGSYTVTITVLNATTNLSSSAMAQVTVNEVNIVPMSATLSPIAGAPFSGRVANFTDPGGAEANDGTHYSASIDWGDHTATTGGVIGFAFNSFRILGAHTFAAAGSYTLTITITHEGTTTTVQESVGVATLGQFVSAGLTMPLGFWEGLQGQQLIRRFGATNSGQTLGQWLATTYPNLYGASNGAPNLSLFTDGQIGSYFQSLFLVSKGTGLDAEVLATALEIFATTESLGGTTAQTHGFTVTSNGLGAYSWNIGPSGQAFDVPNNTTLDVYQILMGANNFAVGGEPWDSDSFLRNQAYAVFRAINGG
ncbi:MAG TPA: PKD domain-containing protein, partial [Gemmataceae bacterium]|nr:PKD domain-containing protein [Gemmataceae bacterium]